MTGVQTCALPICDGTLRLRAESLRHRTYYRMDATRPLRDERFFWPSEVLVAQVRISAHRGRRFRLIVDAVSAGSWTMGVARK